MSSKLKRKPFFERPLSDNNKRGRLNSRPIGENDEDKKNRKELKKSVEKVQGLLKRTCRIYNLTSPSKMNLEEISLVRYARHLKSSFMETLSLDEQDYIEYTAQFIVLKGIKKSSADLDPLYFEITKKKTDEENRDRSGEELVCSGLFSSCSFKSSSSTAGSSSNTKFLKLPVLIYQGLLKYWPSVHSSLQNIFACTIVSHPLEARHIKTLAGLWISNRIKKIDDDIEISPTLYFHTEPEKKNKNEKIQVTLTCLSEDWRGVTDLNYHASLIAASNQIETIWEKMFARYADINLMNLDDTILDKITLKDFVTDIYGKIKFLVEDLDDIQRVLGILTIMAESF